MKLKHSLTAAALAAVLVTPAFAQSNTAPAQANRSSGEKFVQKQEANDWRGSKLIGTTVYGGDNASIGEVSDVLIGNDGTIRAAVIGVGGFLGVSEKNVAIPFNALKITGRPDSSSIQKISVSYTKDELKSAPNFSYVDVTTTTGSGLNNLSGSSGTGAPAAPSGGGMQK